MRVIALWGERRGYEGQVPELMEAWDTYTLEGNPEGWDLACKQAIDSWGDDLVQWRVIELEVSEPALLKAFEPKVLAAGIAEVSAPLGDEQQSDRP